MIAYIWLDAGDGLKQYSLRPFNILFYLFLTLLHGMQNLYPFIHYNRNKYPQDAFLYVYIFVRFLKRTN